MQTTYTRPIWLCLTALVGIIALVFFARSIHSPAETEATNDLIVDEGCIAIVTTQPMLDFALTSREIDTYEELIAKLKEAGLGKHLLITVNVARQQSGRVIETPVFVKIGERSAQFEPDHRLLEVIAETSKKGKEGMPQLVIVPENTQEGFKGLTPAEAWERMQPILEE